MVPIKWNDKTYKTFINYLSSVKDTKYRDFHKSLVLDSKYEMLGIRVPILKSLAKEIAKIDIEEYLNVKKGNYYEEVMLEGLVISHIKDEKVFYKYFNRFIDKIDNWAICDTFSSSIKIVEKYEDKYFNICIDLINTNIEFKTRLGLIIILNHFISEENTPKILDIINNIKSDKYYINMAIAWLVAELYIKQKDMTLEFIKDNKLDKFTQNKAISKINDSFRVSKEEKEYLKKYKK